MRSLLLVALAAVLLAATPVEARPTVGRLRTEYAVNPLGLDVRRPRLSWEIASDRRGEVQTAYQVLVATSEAALAAGKADVWDSGRVGSDRSAHVAYEGPALRSGGRYFWKVRVWGRDGQPSTWSDAAWWEMGLLDPADWHARWIGAHAGADTLSAPRPYLRRTFTLDRPVRRARLYITALGLYRPYLNGRRVGGDELTPGWTDYRHRVQVQTYDVTALLAQGPNALGVLLADGWYAGHVGLWGPHYYGRRPALLAQLEVEYADGTRTRVGTDEGWRASAGALLASDIIQGETYDARREMPGWDTPAFDAAGWAPVVLREPYAGRLVAQYDEPVQVTEEIRPVAVTNPAPGTYIFDMGQNMVGYARLHVEGPAGAVVTLRFAEMLNPDGTLYTANLRGARQTDVYTLRGQGPEVYEPHFTFHGFRYVEVTGYPGTPTAAALVGRVLHSATPPSGRFVTRHEMLNRLQHNIVWGQRGNFVSVPTDCPQRDERLGWMGDAQIFIPTAAFNMDVARFFTKWMTDVTDAQRADGAFTDVSPDLERRLGAGSAGWGDAGVIVPWTLYLRYGDERVLEASYPAMTRWIDYLVAHSRGLIRPAEGYGDWLNVGDETPKEVLATAYFAHSADLTARTAHVLGRTAEAERYEALFRAVRAAFDSAFVAPDATIHGNTQTAYVLALAMNLLPEAQRPAAAAHLAARIEAREGHLSTGFLGVGHLMPVLTDAGRLDLAYRLLFTDTYPSWFYPIRQGATTIWERWDGWTEAGGFQDPGMNSFNHYSLGSVGDWLYRTVGGIDPDPQRPGYRHVRIRPRPGGGLDYALTEYHSLYGPIRTEWERREGRFMLAVSVPPNTTATVHVPAASLGAVTEGGGPAARADGVTAARMEGGEAVFEIGSGTYRFEAR